MQLSYKPISHNKVDYYPLPSGYADVFLHRNEKTETNEGGSIQYVAEEIYFRVDMLITKEQIEVNFDSMWNNAENPVREPTLEERTRVLEDVVLILMME